MHGKDGNYIEKYITSSVKEQNWNTASVWNEFATLKKFNKLL